MTALKRLRRIGAAVACLLSGAAWGGYYPMYASWPQAGGPGSAITLTYSYGNLLDGSIATFKGESLAVDVLKGAFEQALLDYANVLPIHFVEVADAGPLPETGQYDPTGLAQIRIGQVPNVDDANAYAYFPLDTDTSGLAGDIVFNAQRFGLGWTPTFFYAVAQHELGHSLGMGHYVDEPATTAASFAGASYTGPLIPLNQGNIDALQGVYGAGVGSVTPLSAVPEPGAWIMLLAGLLLVLRRSTP
jgi:hypothetical protein